MSIKTKLFFIALLPVALISVAMVFVIDLQSSRMARAQGETVRKMYTDIKHAELRNYVMLARNALNPIYTSNLKTKRQAQREVAEIARKMTFGTDSYFFIYEGDGKNIVNPRLTHLVGSNWIGLEDDDGRHVVRDLIERARRGGEFYSYIWKKPSSGEYVEKLGYSVYLDKWNWMLGTGIYMDDVSEQVAMVQTELSNNVKQTRLVLFVLSLGAIILTAAIIANARLSEQKMADTRLKELTARLVDAQELERKRVSRELHDSISQLLVSTRYGLETALSRTRRNSKVSEPIAKSMHALDNAISEVRRISIALRPSVLDDMGLASAVTSLGAEFAKHSNIAVAVQVDQVRDLLSEEAKTALYRVIQEGLTNVARHSSARHVRIRLIRRGAHVILELDDDGRGLAGNRDVTNSGGIGIRNMEERIDTFDGTIQFLRSKMGGLAIRVSLPIEKRRAKIAA